MKIGLGLGFSKGGAGRFDPAKVDDLIADYDAADTSQMTFASGSGLGGTVSQIANKANPGTYDLKSSVVHGFGSNHPAYLIGRGDHPCVSNLDAIEASFWTTEEIFGSGGAAGRTFIHVGHLREDSVFALWQGGIFLTGTSYINTSGVLRYSDIEGAGDIDLLSGMSVAGGLIITAYVFNSDSDCDFYTNDTANTVNFDPKDSALNKVYVPMGRYNGGAGTAKQEMYRSLVYDRALTVDELDYLFDGLRSALQPSGAVNIVSLDGQSNADGKRFLGFASSFENEYRLKVWGYDDVLRDYDPAVAVGDKTGSLYPVFDGGSAPAYSMAPAMGDYLARRIPGDIVFVPNARDGLDLTTAAEWGERVVDLFDTSTLIGAANTRVQNAVTATGGAVLGAVWQQGEADAHSTVAASQAVYDSALDTFIDDRRSALGLPDMPYSIGVISDDCPNPPHTNLADVQAAQLNFTKVNVTVVDTSDSVEFPTFDDVHYDEVGLDKAGAAHGASFV